MKKVITLTRVEVRFLLECIDLHLSKGGRLKEAERDFFIEYSRELSENHRELTLLAIPKLDIVTDVKTSNGILHLLRKCVASGLVNYKSANILANKFKFSKEEIEKYNQMVYRRLGEKKYIINSCKEGAFLCSFFIFL